MSHADELRKIFSETLRLAEQSVAIADQHATLRKVATDKGFDWSQLKSLATAHARDSEDGGKRVERLLTKADFASSYAAMLDLSPAEHEQERKTRSSSPSVASASLSDGAARSVSPISSERAASNPQTVVSPPQGHDGAAFTATAPTAPSEGRTIPIEPAARMALISGGESDPDREAGLPAGSTTSDDLDITKQPWKAGLDALRAR